MKITNTPILLVEDDQVDVMTVNRALKEIHVTNPVVNLENGEEALKYLRDPKNAKPCIILLDLNIAHHRRIDEERSPTHTSWRLVWLPITVWRVRYWAKCWACRGAVRWRWMQWRTGLLRIWPPW